MKPLVLYHSGCWDGFCAAWVAHQALGDIEAKAVHYGTPAPDVKGREVFILDFSYPYEDMAAMAAMATSLTVMDHHKSSQDALCKLADLMAMHERPRRVIFSNEKSGGRLAWEYFSALAGWDPLSPWLVDFTEDRDLWRHALPYSHEINAALRSYPLDFALWDKISKDPFILDRFVEEGQTIRRMEKQIVDQHVRHARLLSIGGYEVKVVNASILFSEIAGELAKGMPFGAVYFDRSDGKRQWSLRSEPGGLDVSEVAKRLGGGGHANAAGFEGEAIK